MSQKRALTWSLSEMLAGLLLLAFLLYKVPPVTADGQTDLVVVGAFIVASMIMVSGVAAVVFLVFHRRWPAMAGAHRGDPEPFVAIRQGMLTGATVGMFAMLALARMLDIAFVIGIILIAGLAEAYLQSRQ
jgi:hypothetical protein